MLWRKTGQGKFGGGGRVGPTPRGGDFWWKLEGGERACHVSLWASSASPYIPYIHGEWNSQWQAPEAGVCLTRWKKSREASVSSTEWTRREQAMSPEKQQAPNGTGSCLLNQSVLWNRSSKGCVIWLMFQKNQSGCYSGNRLRRGKVCNNWGKKERGLDQCGGEKWLDSGHFEGQLSRVSWWVGVGEYHPSYSKPSPA